MGLRKGVGLAGVLLIASLGLELGSPHAARASDVSCKAEAQGALVVPFISTGLGTVNAQEDFAGSGTCAALNGESFSITLTITEQYSPDGGTTWNNNPSCDPVVVGPAHSQSTLPGEASVASAQGSSGCTFAAGDPSLGKLHRTYTTVTADVGGGDTNTSAPWLVEVISD